VDLSDQRRSHTSNPRLRFFLSKLQFCILILRDRSSGAGKMFTDQEPSIARTKLNNLILLRIQEKTALWRQESLRGSLRSS
jgi:hypothetical protein